MDNSHMWWPLNLSEFSQAAAFFLSSQEVTYSITQRDAVICHVEEFNHVINLSLQKMMKYQREQRKWQNFLIAHLSQSITTIMSYYTYTHTHILTLMQTHAVFISIVGFSVVRVTYGPFRQEKTPLWCIGFSHREVTVSVFTSHSEKSTLSLSLPLSLFLCPHLSLSVKFPFTWLCWPGRFSPSLSCSFFYFLYVQGKKMKSEHLYTRQMKPPLSVLLLPPTAENPSAQNALLKLQFFNQSKCKHRLPHSYYRVQLQNLSIYALFLLH